MLRTTNTGKLSTLFALARNRQCRYNSALDLGWLVSGLFSSPSLAPRYYFMGHKLLTLALRNSGRTYCNDSGFQEYEKWQQAEGDDEGCPAAEGEHSLDTSEVASIEIKIV